MKSRNVLSLLLLLLSTPLPAQWQPDGLVACGAAGHQFNQVAVSDNSGIIVVWEDYRSGETDIFARKITTAGVPQWQTDGVAVCTTLKVQLNLAVVSDGAGGVIVVWEDNRTGTSAPDLYAQRISSTGAALWAPNGVMVCNAPGVQMRAVTVSDGQQGAIITWEDYRGGPADIFAQRVSATGVVLWQAGGVPLVSVAGARYVPAIAADSSGGAIIAWEENRTGSEYDIYAQRINNSGVTQWGSSGLAVCTAAAQQTHLAGYSTGTGQLLLAWQDYRTSQAEIYAQILTPSGLQWPGNGVSVCITSGTQEWPKLVTDGSGGMIVAWTDYRDGNGDIYTRRIDSAGVGQWGSTGNPACMAAGTQHQVSICPSGVGGAIVTWMDYRLPKGDIYAQLVDSAGYSLWINNGSPVCVQSGVQQRPWIAQDFQRGAFVAWTDYRTFEADIRVTRMDRYGTAMPVELLSFSGERRPDGVLLRWRTASESNLLGFEVQSEELGAFRPQGFVPAKSADGGDYQYLVTTGNSLVYRLRALDYDGSETFSPVLRITEALPSALALVSLAPLPVRDLLTVMLDAPAGLPLRIAIYDLAGRKHRTVETTTLGGREVRTVDIARLPAGMYVLEIANAGSVHTALFPVHR